ncbi:PASTA domain-containing protein [Sphaerisporangium album]|uniref:PASTA domain-containing protein n=1 Tax=Sphaerisporangium album TaxID=509200 RepID=A0A367FPK9_9ACTN|nr:PASTA domain-containing protein [Sphaerisporangium album]
MPVRVSCFLAATVLAGLTGCGAQSGTAAPVVTVTATEPAPAVTVTEVATETPVAKPARVQRKVLPNVVGMNLQAAQDKLQATGFYVLNDKDATGQGRFQVLDRNWVVTQQTPGAGQKLPTDTLITLYAKKYGE